MTVSPTPPVSSPSTSNNSAAAVSQSAAAAATVNYNQFLQILVSELQNQDPTSPADPTQYISQLASFSQVGQQINTNTTLGTMLTSQSLQQAETMIGQQITSSDGKTTGVVASVTLSTSGGITANLTNGSIITLTTGSSAGTATTLTDGSQFTLPTGVVFGP
jgi:flagellar basal-body rod modification protein FlgD